MLDKTNAVVGGRASAGGEARSCRCACETRNSKLDTLDQRLLNDFQHGFPLSPTPYADMARALGVSEAEVLARLAALMQAGAVSRVGAVVRPNS
jgi:DNA-binding Lrp family transcriptional regulator